MSPLSNSYRPAFAHCSDTTQRVNQALNFFARHNNFTKFPEGMECITSKAMKVTNDQAAAGAWAMMSALLFIFLMIILNCNFKYMNWSGPDRNFEQEEEEKTPFLAQEEKSI
ncbi:hypothetical protein BCIN_07g03850 [Botrytis cinerea B05.10]|uniref:Uncharacterized protein n=2 Tax=Botryotinia fuckeliana TaxID=40559 RepID=A0A384JMK9_BOTFB|nr:hypothetical protein BCIN_07g03850 [Botrytis cinerea B05.10]ATZ51818.1 hypothetical protein BCIN_07g03850 [Botrytis cinerea B05.10]